jgi:hypothetical protein
MATVAAPTFFGAQRIGSNDYIDGGLGANNPTLLMLREAKKRWNVDRDELGLCISIGSGRFGHPIDTSKASGFSYLLTWASMLTNMTTETRTPRLSLQAYSKTSQSGSPIRCTSASVSIKD